MKSGGARYHYGLAIYNVEPTFMNKEVTGEEFVQRIAAFKQDSEWDQRRKEHWSARHASQVPRQWLWAASFGCGV